jgi:hypothetical protein
MRQALIDIAKQLIGIDSADLSTAESNIMDILVENGIVFHDGSEYKLVK